MRWKILDMKTCSALTPENAILGEADKRYTISLVKLPVSNTTVDLVRGLARVALDKV